MIRSLIGLAAIGYVVWRMQDKRSAGDPGHPSHHGAKGAVNTWEGEGGSLPDQPAVPGQREPQPAPLH